VSVGVFSGRTHIPAITRGNNPGSESARFKHFRDSKIPLSISLFDLIRKSERVYRIKGNFSFLMDTPHGEMKKEEEEEEGKS
jgi:hypothetical protein